jgi:hypothetical protein
MPSRDPLPTPFLLLREHKGEPFDEAKFRHSGQQVKRRIGPAWLTRDNAGAWVARHGRVADGYFDERRAHVAASEIVRTSDLAEPGTPHKRGTRTTAGLIMAVLGDKPASKITPAEVEALLRTVAATGVSARSVNRAREIVCAAVNYGMKPTTYSLPTNPALDTDRRRVPEPGVLLFYSPEEIEAIARSLQAGFHRPAVLARGELEHFEDDRDAEAIRVAAYSGLRLGELLALRWRDVDWTGTALTSARTSSPPTTTSSATRSAGRSMALLSAAATSEPATPPACARCAGMTSATRSGRCSSPAASTW